MPRGEGWRVLLRATERSKTRWQGFEIAFWKGRLSYVTKAGSLGSTIPTSIDCFEKLSCSELALWRFQTNFQKVYYRASDLHKNVYAALKAIAGLTP